MLLRVESLLQYTSLWGTSIGSCWHVIKTCIFASCNPTSIAHPSSRMIGWVAIFYTYSIAKLTISGTNWWCSDVYRVFSINICWCCCLVRCPSSRVKVVCWFHYRWIVPRRGVQIDWGSCSIGGWWSISNSSWRGRGGVKTRIITTIIPSVTIITGGATMQQIAAIIITVPVIVSRRGAVVCLKKRKW